jgi:hypothetical protein
MTTRWPMTPVRALLRRLKGPPDTPRTRSCPPRALSTESAALPVASHCTNGSNTGDGYGSDESVTDPNGSPPGLTL